MVLVADYRIESDQCGHDLLALGSFRIYFRVQKLDCLKNKSEKM